MAAGDGNTEGSGVGGTIASVREWILLDGPRGVVAGATTGLLFAFISLVSVSNASPLRNVQALFYVFGGLIGGNLTIITVVVSINQLLLSRELMTPDELRSQIEGVIDYRDDVEEAVGRIAPVEPMGFLRLLIESTRQTAQQLGGLSFSETPDEVADDVDRIVSRITESADRVDGLLQQSDASTFTVLSATLTTNYARDIHRLRQIQARSGDHLPSDVADRIDDLIYRLRNIDIARQYFKSVYLQQELAALSRTLFYVGLPAVAVVVATLLLLTARGGASVPRPSLAVIVPATITVGLVPLCVLFAFILRTATVTRRTAAVIPFTAPTQEK